MELVFELNIKNKVIACTGEANLEKLLSLDYFDQH